MPADEALLIVEPDGRVHGLYTDLVSLGELGVLEVQRASTVEFDPAVQEWTVVLSDGECLGSCRSRADAISLEVRTIQSRLVAGL